MSRRVSIFFQTVVGAIVVVAVAVTGTDGLGIGGLESILLLLFSFLLSIAFVSAVLVTAGRKDPKIIMRKKNDPTQ